MQFIGQKVGVRFLPGDETSAYILYGGEHCPLRLTDRVANGRPKRNPAIVIDYRKVWRMLTDYYGLGFNPFNKQNIKEKDACISYDHRQTQERLEYLCFKSLG